METQEKIKTYADVFGELPRNVQYNLRAAVCKTLSIKPSDFYRLLAYRFDETAEHTRGTFFDYFTKMIKDWEWLCEHPKLRQALDDKKIYFGTPKNPIKAEREYIIQARNEAIIKGAPNPALYPETYLKPYWNATKTTTVTRHGVGDTRINKNFRRRTTRKFGFRMFRQANGSSLFFGNRKTHYQGAVSYRSVN